MRHALTTCLTLIALTLLVAPAAVAAEYEFETVVVPGSGPFAFDLNNQGQIVGWFTDDGSGATRGFVLDGEDFTPLDFPGAGATLARGINDAGIIAGQYRLGAEIHGFVFDGEDYLAVDFPGAPTNSWAQDVNGRGDVVGIWCEDPAPPCQFDLTTEVIHGYVVNKDGAFSTVALGVNDQGAIAGLYYDDDLREHGYVLENGVFRTLDVPGATDTEVRRINNRGDVAALFINPDNSIGSAIAEKDGDFAFFAFPGATDTLVFGQNERGDVVGIYFATDGTFSFFGRRLGQP